MAKQTFTTGQVLTAAQMTSLQQTAMGGGSATAKTASYTLVAADAGTTIIMNSASATTITVNTSLFAAGDTVFVVNQGAGVCTITAGTATVSTAGSLSMGQNETGQLYFLSTSAAIFSEYTQTSSGGGLTLLETITFNNTANTYTSATIAGTYKNLRIVGQGLQESGTNAGEINLRFNGDTGANYNYAFIRNTNATIVGRPTSGTAKNEIVTCQSIALSADTSIRFGQIEISIPNYAGSNYKSVNYQCSDNAGGNSNNGAGGGTWNNTAAITSITFIEGNTANFKAGTLLIYGES